MNAPALSAAPVPFEHLLISALTGLAAQPDEAARGQLLSIIVVAEGGTLVNPAPGETWLPAGAPASAVVSLFGVTGLGPDLTEATRDWTARARDALAASDLVRASERIVADPAGAPPEGLAQAIRCVGAWSSDTLARTRAAALESALRAAPGGAA